MRQEKTWWTFRIFFIFFCSGRGKGDSEAPGTGGMGFLLKIPGGGVSRTGEFFGGGGLNIFFGAEMSTKKKHEDELLGPDSRDCPADRDRIVLQEDSLPLHPDPPFHAFFPKKHGLAKKSAVSLPFCPFLHFFGPKKAPFPCFGIFYPRFFRQSCAFFEPPNALVTLKKRG